MSRRRSAEWSLASRTLRSNFCPGLGQGAGLLLRSWRRLSAKAGGPRPANQRVATNVMHEVIQTPAAIAFGVLELCANFAERFAFPTHFTGCQVPLGVARHASRFKIGSLVANWAAHRRKP